MEGNTKEMAYEKAIDGYQFLVNRYHTWMNYYSIFTGAFFIALYTVWEKAEAANIVLLGLFIFLGWFSSICWLASLIGHRAWMGSWIQVVKKWEKQILGEPSQEPWSSVYGKIVTPNTLNTTPTPRYLAQFISTQKVTTIFVYAVILAWDVLLGYFLIPVCDLYRIIAGCALPNNWFVIFGKVFIYILFLGLNWFCLWYINEKTNKCFSDDLTDMIQ
ncbi:MAG: hypothetical protein K2L04_02700 [Alistipes sp.]|nr:hypothetical protein [Alistipes sp.]